MFNRIFLFVIMAIAVAHFHYGIELLTADDLLIILLVRGITEVLMQFKSIKKWL